jgi:hypothetical protein
MVEIGRGKARDAWRIDEKHTCTVDPEILCVTTMSDTGAGQEAIPRADLGSRRTLIYLGFATFSFANDLRGVA